MEFSKEEIEEFKTEALELLDESEKHLSLIEKGGDFKKSYDSVFRVFHSLKGGAGMHGLLDVQAHMHQLESHYQQCKELPALSKDAANYFLRGVDGARHLLDGKKLSFDYQLPGTNNVESAPKVERATVQTTSSPIAELQKKYVTKIFVIDDESEIVEILSDAIRDSGFDPIGFTNPVDALSKLQSEKPDAILCDFKMPQMSGFDVLKQVQIQNPDLPVTFISGHVTKDMVLNAINMGAYSVLEKPFQVSQVINICSSSTHRHQLIKVLNNAISFIFFQYAELDEFLKSKGDPTLRELMTSQLKALIEARRQLKTLKRV